MRSWFVSLDGALVISGVALLSLLWRSLLDIRYVLTEDMPNAGKGIVAAWTLSIAALVGGWIWALLAGQAGARGGLIVLFALALITGLYGLASLLAFRPIMPSAKPMGEIALWSNLLTGVLATISVGFRLWGKA